MAKYIQLHNISHRNIYLIFGCRFLGDTLYGQEMKALEEELANFYYLPTYSRETGNEELLLKGYVHNVYEKIITSGKPDAKFFLCGWKNMIDDARQKIVALGYDKKDIHFELYG